MLRPSELKVKPVRRYKVPKYPSHEDPDPTLYPRPVPFPASNKLLAAVASFGLATGVGCAPPADTGTPGNTLSPVDSPTSSNVTNPFDTAVSGESDPFGFSDPDPPPDPGVEDTETEDQRKADAKLASEAKRRHDLMLAAFTYAQEASDHSVAAKDILKLLSSGTSPMTGNPFTVAFSGLPHRSSPYGTGVPDYLDGDLARKTIGKIFADSGYQLQKNYAYSKDGIEFVADGYDPERKVGYVVGDWGNLDFDAIIGWWVQPSKKGLGETDATIALLAQFSNSDVELKTEIAEAQKLSDPAHREVAFRAIIRKHGSKHLSLAEIAEIEEQAKQGDFIAVISTYDTRFVAGGGIASLDNNALEELSKVSDPAKRAALAKAAIDRSAQQQIDLLEQAAREYIAWARRNGGN